MTTSSFTRMPVRADTALIAVIVALAVAAVVFVMSQRPQQLRGSAVGMDGLQVWLASSGLSAQVFSGGWLPDPNRIGLLVLPMYDTRPDIPLEPAATRDGILRQQDESDLDWASLTEKAEAVPTLVVLPKWRSGMRLMRRAHPDLLVDAGRLDAVLQRLTGDATIRLHRNGEAITKPSYRTPAGQDIGTALYLAQLFDGSACDPILGSGKATLLASCPLGGSDRSVLILSDPDLLNNHGLRLGQNAEFARTFFEPFAASGTVMIDYSRENWFAKPDAPPERTQTWGDLLRFFQPPFLALWLGAGLLLCLALWRSLRRAGPVAPTADAGMGKLLATRARARLMRLTGQDGAMLGDYADARIAATAARLVGPSQARHIGEERQFLRFVARHRPDLSERLATRLTRLRALPGRVPASVAIRQVEALEDILEQIADDT
jgi:hypothetical protein